MAKKPENNNCNSGDCTIDFDSRYKNLADEIIKLQYPFLNEMHYKVRDRAEKTRDDIKDMIRHFVDELMGDVAKQNLVLTRQVLRLKKQRA